MIDPLLVAAAPDLLQVCKRLLKELEADEITIGAEEDLRAAIDKAEGRQHEATDSS